MLDNFVQESLERAARILVPRARDPTNRIAGSGDAWPAWNALGWD